MTIRWRRGLSGASTEERFLILEAEHHARQMALQEAYEERCAQLGSIIVDARDLAVRCTSVRWGRHKGCLYLRISVHYRPARRVRTYSWRARLRSSRSSEVSRGVNSFTDRMTM